MIVGISKGRVQREFFDYAFSKDVLCPKDVVYNRNLICNVEFDSYCLLKSNDIINYLLNGCIDIGILGSDVINEISSNDIVSIFNFNTANAYFALASFRGVNLNDIKIVATKYPNTAARMMEAWGLSFDIVKMDGSLELAPNLGYADAIIDIVQSGKTLIENNLEVKGTFNYINTQIVTTKDKMFDYDINDFVRKLK